MQALLSLQTLAVPAQTPVMQASPLVQALPSLQTVASATLTWLQIPVAALQVSVVQVLLSLQAAAPLQPVVTATSSTNHPVPLLLVLLIESKRKRIWNLLPARADKSIVILVHALIPVALSICWATARVTKPSVETSTQR